MKNAYKLALLAALGLASATAAQAQDLFLGFNDAAGPTTAQNDYVINTGFTEASLLSATATAGGTLDLGTLISSSSFNTAFGTDSNKGNDVAAGVVGSTYPTSPVTISITGSTTPVTYSSGSAFNLAGGAAGASPTGVYSSSGQSGSNPGWTYNVAASPTASSGNPQGLAGLGSNPMENLSSGVLTINLYNALRGGTALKPTAGAFSFVGAFTINTITDDVSFSTVSIPEPASYGFLAAGGLLFVAIRRQLTGRIA